MQICKFILGQVACMKRGPHYDSVIYKDLKQIFISDQGTRCLFLEKKGGVGWSGGGVVIWSGPCYLQRGRELSLFVTQCYCYRNAVCVG